MSHGLRMACKVMTDHKITDGASVVREQRGPGPTWHSFSEWERRGTCGGDGEGAASEVGGEPRD